MNNPVAYEDMNIPAFIDYLQEDILPEFEKMKEELLILRKTIYDLECKIEILERLTY